MKRIIKADWNMLNTTKEKPKICGARIPGLSWKANKYTKTLSFACKPPKARHWECTKLDCPCECHAK